MSLALAELDAIYATVPHEEAVAIANLGAQCYLAVKDRLYTSWTAIQEATQDDAGQEELWRTEGAASMLESLKGRLAAGDAAQARVATLQASLEAELTRRMEEVLSVRMKEVELAKREEMLAMEKRLVELQSGAKYTAMLEEAHSALKGELIQLREENCKFKETTAVKSSHALGKMGEATVFEMLDTYVAPKLAYAEVIDTTKLKHAADFQLSMLGPSGKRYKIMIDVKNYTTPVRSCELEKLYSDMDTDDTTSAGIIVSMNSGIWTKEQFDMAITEKNKPCLFLSFEHLDDSMRKDVLLWAVNTLVCFLSHRKDATNEETILTDIYSFIDLMNTLTGSLGDCVKMSEQLHKSLRTLHQRFIQEITAFQEKCNITRTQKQTLSVVKEAGQCQAIKPNGEQCKVKGKQLVGEYCKHHAPKTDVISLLE
jgi:hypothetical protein